MNIKQYQILRQELAKPQYAVDLGAKAYQTIADALNEQAETANPVSRPTRPKLLTWDTFIGLLAPADVLVLYSYGQLARDLRLALEANDRTETLAIWRGLKTQLTQPSITAVQQEAQKTEPDPDWPATILQPSIAMTLGLPHVKPEDVQTVHHRVAGV